MATGTFDAPVEIVQTRRRESIEIVVAARAGDVVLAQLQRECPARLSVVAEALRIEAVGLDLFVPKAATCFSVPARSCAIGWRMVYSCSPIL
jgi:hypothetical protein